jgi:hypothetical protein
MDSFGEFEALNHIGNEVTLKTASIGSYYSVVIDELMGINHPFVDLVREKGLPYPDKGELEWRFEVQAKVEKCKKLVKKKMRLYQ